MSRGRGGNLPQKLAECLGEEGTPAHPYGSANDDAGDAMNIMRVSLLAVLLLLNPAAYAQVIQFDSVPNPLQLPADLHFGEVTGVAVNSKGNVFVLSRGNTSGPAYAAAATQLLEFDAGGKFVREIGKNLYAWSFGHSVRVDREDNVWVTDKGSDMVVRFNPQGHVTMLFGRKQEASDETTAP